ncbi:unnamed protein product [Rhizophagus irregularis]|nr:unnamed protein product [Rhizophagus irregularis]
MSGRSSSLCQRVECSTLTMLVNISTFLRTSANYACHRNSLCLDALLSYASRPLPITGIMNIMVDNFWQHIKHKVTRKKEILLSSPKIVYFKSPTADSEFMHQLSFCNHSLKDLRRKSRQVLLNHLEKVYQDSQKIDEYFNGRIVKYLENNEDLQELENDH